MKLNNEVNKSCFSNNLQNFKIEKVKKNHQNHQFLISDADLIHG